MRAQRAGAASGLLFCCVPSHLDRGPEAHRGAVAGRGHAETSVGQLFVLSPNRRKSQQMWRGSGADVLPWAWGQGGSSAQKPKEAAGCSGTLRPHPQTAQVLLQQRPVLCRSPLCCLGLLHPQLLCCLHPAQVTCFEV